MAEKTLWDYMKDPIHEFRMKFATDLTDDQLDIIERHLQKYDAYDISTPKTTPIQKNPIDFRQLNNTVVTIIDFKSRLPVSPYQLRQELVQKLSLRENHIVVRNKKEPLHIEDEKITE